MLCDCVRIELTQGFYALIDRGDESMIRRYKWCYSCQNGKGYALTAIRRKLVRMHTMIMGAKNVDHKNQNGLDNRRSNLRVCTNQQNSMNRGANSNSGTGYKGVSYSPKYRKYMVYIAMDGKTKYLGGFDRPEDAATVYNYAAYEAMGEYAYMNKQ